MFGLVCNEGAGGAFYLFIAGGRSWVHVTAGPCLTARGRDAAGVAGSVAFRLDTGERREIAADRTVSRNQGEQPSAIGSARSGSGLSWYGSQTPNQALQQTGGARLVSQMCRLFRPAGC